MASANMKFAHLKIPLEEVVKATNNFDEKYVIGKGDFGKIYKGQLMRSGKMVNIAARRLDRKHGQGDVEFWTEICVLSSLEHENLVVLIGFCDENGEKIIINKREASKGSLLFHLSNPTLTRIQRLNICVGVARALRYIHNGEERGYSVIHRNINSSTVLLDDNWEAKLSGFEFSIKQSVDRMGQVVLSEAIGTTGYMDPSIGETGGVSHQSDIYSFGVVLCEILCGRKAFIPDHHVDVDHRLLAPLFISHYQSGTLNDIIHPDLRNRVSQQSLISFSKAAYFCLKKERLERLDINILVNMLEHALEVQQRLENLRKNLEHLKIPLGDIMLATNNFSEAYRIRNTGYYNLYRAELEHFDEEENSCIKEDKNKGQVSRRRSTVVIKHFLPREDDVVEKVLYTEMEVLNTCKHPNIVKLLGFCDEGSEMILVLEHLSKGYLADYWENLNNDMPILTWVKRLKICLDVAHALNYLHNQLEDEMVIIHRDIRSAYIALDENWGAKIVDFGRSVLDRYDDRTLHLSPYYRDPESWVRGGLSRKSDVYSFGVVLFEVLSGKLADDPIYRKKSDELGLAFVAQRCSQDETLTELMDPILKEELGINKDSLDKFVKIARVCIEYNQERRPTMKKVIKELQKALSFQEQIQESDMVQDVHELTHENDKQIQESDMVQDVHELTHENDVQLFVLVHELPKLPERLTRENYGEQLQHSDIVQVDELEKPHENYEQIQESDVVQDVHDVDQPIQPELTDENDEEQTHNMDRVVHEIEKVLKELQLSDMFQVVVEVEEPHENYRKNLEHLKIPLRDIKSVTNNFSEAYHIRDTGYYNLYRVELEHFDSESPSIKEEKNRHKTVVIKRIYTVHKDGERGFDNEIQMLATCKHPNIIKLFGFCDEDSEMILVIEDLPNGYLIDYLGNISTRCILTWAKRLEICLDVAKALSYIHSEMEDQKTIIHRDIKSLHIVLGENLQAKVIDFGLSVFLPPNQDDEALHPNTVGGTPCYIDPEYVKTGRLKRESDVYSFGVVLFEVLCGKLANDPIYTEESREGGLAFVARRCFQEETLLSEMVDPILKEQRDTENRFILNTGPNKDSLEKFVKIAHQCVAETQDQRPKMKVVVKELQEALFFQENYKDGPIISLEDIKLATQNFHHENLIGRGGSGEVYKGKLPRGDGFNTIVAKRLDTTGRSRQGEQQFRNELQILFEYKHENIISLVGYCNENDEKVIVYEHASRGSLDRYLKDAGLTWMKRLKICIDVATALAYLHGGAGKQAIVIHRDIKAANILLYDEWNAKLADFGLSLISSINEETDYAIEHPCGTKGYVDPLYSTSNFLTIESDIYSFGVVLFEILCGSFLHKQVGFIKKSFEKGKHDDLVFKALKEQIVPKALTAFQTIAYKCLHDTREKRPTTKEVLEQLKEALEFQISGSTD